MTKVSGKLINTREVADLLGVTTQTILNWVKNGVLKPFKSANNAMYFSRKYINEFCAEIDDIFLQEAIVDNYKEQLRIASKERDERLKLLKKEIEWRDSYAFNRYVKTISAAAQRLVDIGELPISENEEKVLQRLLSLEPLDTLCDEVGVTYARINQIVKSLYVKLARINSASTKYDKLKEENIRLKKQLIELTTNKSTRNEDILFSPVSKCNFSVRTTHVLNRMGIETIGDLVMTTERTLLSQKGFGATCLKEVQRELNKYNLELEW